MNSRYSPVVRALQFLVLSVVCHGALAEEPVGIVMLELSGLKDASGNVYVAVYDSESTWLGKETVMTRTVAIADALDGELVRVELQVPMGDYALTAFHDADNDGKLKTNFVGMPKEPMALSNNTMANFGPPKFSDAVFTVGAEPMIQSLTMRNP
jgi:uncharacterized protein (DUF2141 family)